VLAAIARSPLVVVGLLAGVGTALVVVAVNMMAASTYSYPSTRTAPYASVPAAAGSTGVVQIVVVPVAMAVIAAPVTLPMLVGVWWGLPLAVTVLGTLAGLAYALILFGWTTYYAGKVDPHEAETLAAASLAR
jgi:hypothetical protein